MSWVDREGYQGPPPKIRREPAPRPPGATQVHQEIHVADYTDREEPRHYISTRKREGWPAA